jgi:hypothetical protein
LRNHDVTAISANGMSPNRFIHKRVSDGQPTGRAEADPASPAMKLMAGKERHLAGSRPRRAMQNFA